MTNTPELEILYQDKNFVAINKPSGLLVHRSPIAEKEKIFALQMVRNQIGQRVFPVHRLDRPTSGVLLFALCPETAGLTAQLFKTGQIQKKYIAVVRGYIPEKGTINHPVKKIKDRYIKRRVKQDDAQNTKPDIESNIKKYPAVTKFKQLATIELPFSVDKYPTSRYSLTELMPKTGRRHQLRLHMKHLSHPIIGDTRYGKDIHNKFFLNTFNCKRLLLAAVEMKFIHPITGADVVITATPDEKFSLILQQLNWNLNLGGKKMNDDNQFSDIKTSEIQMPDPRYLLKLAHTKMPYGKYAGVRLVDLPEPYVVWFSQKGFPEGELGDMLKNIYEIKVNGLEYLFKPLINK